MREEVEESCVNNSERNFLQKHLVSVVIAIIRLPQSSRSFANFHFVTSDVKLPCHDCDVASKYCSIVAKPQRIVAFLLQSLNEFAYNRYSLLGIRAALGAGARTRLL